MPSARGIHRPKHQVDTPRRQVHVSMATRPKSKSKVKSRLVTSLRHRHRLSPLFGDASLCGVRLVKLSCNAACCCSPCSRDSERHRSATTPTTACWIMSPMSRSETSRRWRWNPRPRSQIPSDALLSHTLSPQVFCSRTTALTERTERTASHHTKRLVPDHSFGA